jgi:hypothetical protein
MSWLKITVGLLFVWLLPMGCAADQEHITPEVFCEMYNLPMGTMKFSKYLGVKDSRAVIELHEMPTLGSKKWGKKTFWTEAGGVEDKCLITTE